VLDLDEIVTTLSGLPPHLWGREWLDRALRERNSLLGRLATHASWPAAWLIVSEPEAAKREWWQRTMRPVEIVLIETSKAECVRRVQNRSNEQAIIDRWQAIIDRWFSRYSPRAADRIVITGGDQTAGSTLAITAGNVRTHLLR
jgi:hypothetical protein